MPVKISFWPARMDVLQSITGLALVLFVWGHMFFESSILLGKEEMYWVTKMFEGEPIFGEPYPALVAAVAAIIFALIVVHAFLAMRKFPGNHRQYQQFHRHMGAMRHPDTTLWYVQVITGFSLFFLASAHLYIVFTQPDNIGPYASSDRIWTGRSWLLYAPLLLVVHIHAAIGAYRLAMKWGPLTASNTRVIRPRLKIAMYGIAVFYLCLGSASLITYMKIGYQHADQAGARYQSEKALPSGESH